MSSKEKNQLVTECASGEMVVSIGVISRGCFTAIVSPEGQLMGEPLRSG
jgi:hypothetical protein